DGPDHRDGHPRPRRRGLQRPGALPGRRPHRRRADPTDRRQRPGPHEAVRRPPLILREHRESGRPPMFKTTIRGLMAHKLRLLTSAIAIVIGVAFISGTLVLTSTITTTFNDLFANVYAGTESVARSSSVVDSGENGEQRANIDAGLLSAVRSAPGVATAEGTVQSYAQFVDHDGKAIGDPNQGAPTLA